MKHLKSVFENEQELLKGIIQIHLNNKDIDCDPMFFKGNFYKNGINKPKFIFDINPIVNYCPKGDATNLPLENDSLNSIILDPPYMFDVGGKSKDFYSSITHGIYKNIDDMLNNYELIIKEAYRILKNKGILIFKCQDYRNISIHSIIREFAINNGFKEKDIVILVKPNKIYNPKLNQRIFRKIHTYFWILEKKR